MSELPEIAWFEKVSFEQYKDAWMKARRNLPDDETLRKEWEAIKIPERATAGSAGYDFFMPKVMDFQIGQARFFPTGIRAGIAPGWVLMLFPKSGLGSKFGLRMLNTIPVIDSDYYFSDNEGHIMVGMEAAKSLRLMGGEKYMQGVFLPFGVVKYDDVKTVRNGGFGSTGA